MNKLIENYVYDVVRRLPSKMRDDVGAELKANIYEMIDDDTNEEEVKKVLYSMGSPRSLASSYTAGRKQIISIEWISDYKYVLKLVLIILGSIALVFGLIDAIQNYTSSNAFAIFFEVLSKVIGNVIDSLLSGFAIVTIIFIIIDNYADKDDKWKLEDLPEPPKETNLKISRAGSISGLVFAIIFGALWMYILYYSNIYFGWYTDNGGWNLEVSLFNLDYTRTFVWLFAIAILLDITVYVMKINYSMWNRPLVGAYVLSKVVGVLVSVIFLAGASLINQDFIVRVAAELSFSQSSVENFIKIMRYSIIGIVIFANIIDLISMYFKQFRYVE
jgi:hypothetical protein